MYQYDLKIPENTAKIVYIIIVLNKIKLIK